ncbi:putative signal transduction histidine kinase [Actinobacteria bacterium OK074]|nr:putative signal transduction histidine kinase [Actinobacteria bacterium OK074]
MRRGGANQATGVAFGSLVVLVAGSLLLLAVDVLAQPLGRGSLVTGLVLLILLPAVLLGQYAPPPYRLPHSWRWGLLALQVLLTYLPVLFYEDRWLGLLGFLAGAVLLTVPRPASLVLALAVVASGPLLVHSSLVGGGRGGLSVAVSTTVTGSGIFAVVHLALLAARLQAAQTQTARLAAHRERSRIARDLHDLVGSHLVAIAVRGESTLARTPSSSAAHEALRDIAELARRTHGEVRRIAADRSAADIGGEVAHAQGLLTGAGVAVRSALPPRLDLPTAVGTCLSAVLREATGNVLQHSRATSCAIDVATTDTPHSVRLTVTNNGPLTGSSGQRTGSGLAGLRFRVLALHGTLETTLHDGRFTLTATLPLDPSAPAASNPSVPLGDTDGIDQGACL